MIYFDNSATSYPKPVSVFRQGIKAMKSYSFNSGRGGYKESLKAADKIYEVREKIGDMFGFSPSNVVFTKNCTEALNIAIKGSVKQGDHVIISSLEHNSVSRVTEHLEELGIIECDVAEFSFDEDECVQNFEKLIKPNTSLIVCMHSSNVFGVVFPIAKIGTLCNERGIRFIVDAAQGAGGMKIHSQRDNIDILCAPGHKCLMGPMGTGFLAVKDGVKLNTIMEGGTGSSSLSLKQPESLPERLEAGTLNNAGIIALGEGIHFINTLGIDHIYRHEMSLCQYIYDELSGIDGIVLYTPRPAQHKNMPIISFNIGGCSSEAVAAYLADNHICVRAGYHCSYLAHKHFNTLDTGTVRISLGYFNTLEECDIFLNVLKKF